MASAVQMARNRQAMSSAARMRDPAERPEGVEAEHPAQEQRLGRAHVAVGEGDRLDLPQLFDQAVWHSLASVGRSCKPLAGGQCSGRRGRSLTVRRARQREHVGDHVGPQVRRKARARRGSARRTWSRFPRRSTWVDERLAVVERHGLAGVRVGEQHGERVPAGREARARERSGGAPPPRPPPPASAAAAPGALTLTPAGAGWPVRSGV